MAAKVTLLLTLPGAQSAELSFVVTKPIGNPEPVQTPRVVLYASSAGAVQVSKLAVPLAGAVHEYQTERLLERVELDPELVGSPDSPGAPMVVPLTDPFAPETISVPAKSSFAGGYTHESVNGPPRSIPLNGVPSTRMR